jgi:hypothetical protein
MKNIIKKRRFKTAFLLLIGVLEISFIPNFKKANNKSQVCIDRKLMSAFEYKVFNEKGTLIDAQVFANKKTITGENTKELFVYFKIKPKPFVIVIALDQKLIGIPERYYTMKIDKKNLYIKKESLRFTPINVGIEKLINKYSIEDELIDFETFDRLRTLGKRITIKK